MHGLQLPEGIIVARRHRVVYCEACGKELRTWNNTADHHFCSACWAKKMQIKCKETKRMKLEHVLKSMQTAPANKKYDPPSRKLDSWNVVAQ